MKEIYIIVLYNEYLVPTFTLYEINEEDSPCKAK